MSICEAYSYIIYSEITSNQMFFFILEQYVVMSNRFIMPNVIDSIGVGGWRIRAAQTISRNIQPGTEEKRRLGQGLRSGDKGG